MPETVKLLGSTERKILKDKDRESAPHLEITEVILVHCILLIIMTNKIQASCIQSF